MNIAGHALVGCGSAVASGGSCKSGALAGGTSAAAAPFIGSVSQGNLVAATVLSATAGGLASVAGGGKFANGAITGAFGYLFNQCGADPGHCGIGTAANAVVNGAYSVLEGVGDTFRWLGRSVGVYGPDEAERSDKELTVATVAILEGTKELALSSQARTVAGQIAYSAGKEYLSDELNDYYLAGRAIFGFSTGLGPIAAFGNATRALENGHNTWDALKRGVTGNGGN